MSVDSEKSGLQLTPQEKFRVVMLQRFKKELADIIRNKGFRSISADSLFPIRSHEIVILADLFEHHPEEIIFIVGKANPADDKDTVIVGWTLKNTGRLIFSENGKEISGVRSPEPVLNKS